MQMRPIVNGLEEEFGDRMAFVESNALLEGKQGFEQLTLPGYPSFVIFSPAQREVYRTFGVIDENRLREAIRSQLDGIS